MTISIKPAIHAHVNEAFAKQPMVETLDFVKRLYLTEFETLKADADAVMNRAFNKTTQSDAYLTLLNYTLEKRSLTETLAIFSAVKLEGDNDVVEHNLILLAEEIYSYDNTWWFFKKRNIVEEVKTILNEPPVPVTVETLTNNG